MNTRIGRLGLAATFIIVAVGGCAGNKTKRVTMLENNNRTLTERINTTNAELVSARFDREDLNARLQAALDEIGGLQQQLSERVGDETPAAGWTAVPGGAMIAVEGSILFWPGRAILRADARRTLDTIVSTVQSRYADKNILVLGHTDNQPIVKSGWKDNYELSAERALSVVRYMRERGVVPARLVACGSGEFRPRGDNSTETSRSKNRRVEIYAIDPVMGFGSR